MTERSDANGFVAEQITEAITATGCLLQAAHVVTPESKRLLVEAELRGAIARLEGALAKVLDSSDDLRVALARAERDGDIETTDRMLALIAARSQARMGVCGDEDW